MKRFSELTGFSGTLGLLTEHSDFRSEASEGKINNINKYIGHHTLFSDGSLLQEAPQWCSG